MKKIIVGIGNDIMGDDSVALRVIDALEKMNIDAELDKIFSHGMDVAQRIIGYDYAVIVDSSTEIPPGTVAIVDENFAPMNFDSPHTLSIRASLEILRKVGEKIPKIKIVLVGVENIEFSEEISENAKKGLEKAVNIVKEMIEGGSDEHNHYIR